MIFSPTSCPIIRLRELGEELLQRYELQLCAAKYGSDRTPITYRGIVMDVFNDLLIEEEEKNFLLDLTECHVILLIESYVLHAYSNELEELSRPQMVVAINRFFDAQKRASLYAQAKHDDEAWQKPLVTFRKHFLN